MHYQDVSRYITQLQRSSLLTFLDSLERETEVKQVLACKKDCAKDLALQIQTASFISATSFPAALRGNFPFLFQVFITPLPKLSCICYSPIPVMFSKASSVLPAVNPLPHAAVWELKSKSCKVKLKGGSLEGGPFLLLMEPASPEKIKTLLPKRQKQQQMKGLLSHEELQDES